jgi:quercetin dioxygenase-like cupin family protein
MSEQANDRAPLITHVPAGQGPTTWVDGDAYTVKASKESTNGTLAFLEASIPPGSGPPPHVHTLEDEAFYILSGQLEFLGSGQRFLANAGDFVFVPRGVGHCFKNVSVHAVRMVFLYTPAGFDRFFLEAGQPAVPGTPTPTWGPTEFKRATEIAARYGWQEPPADDPVSRSA